MNANELKRKLAEYGCEFFSHRGGGSHLTVTRRDGPIVRTSQLPMHGKRELGTGLVKKILKDLGLKGAIR